MKTLSSFFLALLTCCFCQAQTICDTVFSTCDSITIDTAWFIHDTEIGDKVLLTLHTDHIMLYAPAFVICPEEEGITFSDASYEFFSIYGPGSVTLLYDFSDFEITDLPVLNGRLINDNSNNSFPHCELHFTMPVNASDAVINHSSEPIILFPNPAQETLFIQHTRQEKLSVSIYSVDASLQLTAVLEGTDAVSIAALHAGLYFYYIGNGETILQTGKFIKQ